MKSRYFDRNGEPLELMGWCALIELGDYKIVRQESVGDYWISTVWLCINHNYGSGPPHIFETMVFGEGNEKYCERYATEAEALAGHLRIVEGARDGTLALYGNEA